MTVTASLDGYTHTHVSERETAHASPCGYDPAGWEDCTSVSGVELLRAMGHTTIPPTLAEAEALRCAGGVGPTGGEGQDAIRLGALRRYGIALPLPLASLAALVASLAPGTVASVQGSMAAFPAGHRLRRFDPPFAGAHDVLVARPDATDRYWWCDPLAPQDGTYAGEWVTSAELAAFVSALSGARHLVGRIVPDVVAVQHRLSIAAGVTRLYLASLTADAPPKIASYRPVPWSGLASSAPCDPPLRLVGTGGGRATVARVQAGATELVGQYVRVSVADGTSVSP